MKPFFEHWPTVTERLQAASGAFIAFDFDGVLAPIVPPFEHAAMSPQTIACLARLAEHPKIKIAFVTGRPLANIRQKINLETLLYAGNHGAEIGFGSTVERHIEIELYRPYLLAVRMRLTPWQTEFPGVSIEDKGFGIVFHYRKVDPKDLPALHQQFHQWARNLPSTLRVLPAKMLYEIRPNVKWNKGSAVLRLWKAVAPEALPFCLGDDRTDEDSFTALAGKGISIFVGEEKNSCADYFLSSTDDVLLFMRRLLAAL